jgi:hypothetical protein
MRLHVPSDSGTSCAGLLEQFPDAALDKVTRSTIPLLAFWCDESRRRALLEALAVQHPADAEAVFEHRTPWKCDRCNPPAQKATDSHTDVMVWTPQVVVAVEAKYREALYESTDRWLDRGSVRANREAVLDHWLHLIGTDTPRERVGGLIYQMLHRTAAACHWSRKQGAARTIVLLLDLGEGHAEEYARALADVGTVLQIADRVEFWNAQVPASPTREARALAAEQPEASESFSARVREGLDGNQLYTFPAPSEWHVHRVGS